MHTVALLLLVAVLGATAFTPPRLFGPPRTRAQALAYAKKAVYKDADKDSVAATPVAPLKGSRQRRVEMMIDPACVPGSVIVPDWFLPVAAASALTLPVMIAFTFGDMDTDKFRRERNGGVTLEQRAVGDFQRGLTRALQRVGVLAKPPPTTARSELGLRSNQAAVTMLAVDEQEEVETSACIMFEGRRVCGSARLQEDGMTCVWNGQRWVCVDL